MVSFRVFSPQLKLMTSWAVVCDVYFLPPQTRGENETAQQFAERCQVPGPVLLWQIPTFQPWAPLLH